MKIIAGLAEIAAQYGGMLIDQFGVIHDGARLYPGTLTVLEELNRARIPVAVMTNSGKRADANVARLTHMGIARNLFVDAVSSGEVAYHLLERASARRAYIIGRHGDDYGFDRFPLTDDPHEADVLLILGSNAPKTSLQQYRRMLADVTVPAICCNPDKLMLTSSGLQPAPGAIAALYESMGRKVTWIGKPYPEIYRHALSVIGNPKRVLCIGDSAEHDVAGGRGAGLDTLLVRTGISADATDFDPEPDYLMERFIWR
jgi:HAD superfamily hydrolase (TIGR01459 family)